MNEYRKTVKNRLILLSICAALSLTAVLVGFRLAALSETPDGTFNDGFFKGLPIGLFTGFCGLIVFNIAQHVKALSSESVLKKLYISENDERKKIIRQSAFGKSFFFTTGILVVGITVASFFDSTVTLTLMAVLTAHALAGGIFKLYYFTRF